MRSCRNGRRRKGPITAKKDTIGNSVRAQKESRGGGTRTKWKDNGGEHKGRSLLCHYRGTGL